MAEDTSDRDMSKMNRNRTGQGALMFVAAGLLGLSACKDTQDTPVEADTYSSLVSERGEISFPADFPDGFRFIGSWAVAGEGGVADIHSVYARPSDVDAFRQAGRFPDGAVLIKEVSASRGAKHTTGEAFWPTDTKTWFMMVKDAKGRFGDNPLWGDGWGWAQFDPKNTSRSASVRARPVRAALRILLVKKHPLFYQLKSRKRYVVCGFVSAKIY